MSLIIDALKMAQELRLKGSERPPFLKTPSLHQNQRRVSKRRWLLIGGGFIGLGLCLLGILKPNFPPPQAISARQDISPIKMEKPTPVIEKIPQEIVREDLNLSEGSTSLPRREEKSIEAKPALHAMSEQVLLKETMVKEELKPLEKIPSRNHSPFHMTRKEEAPPQSIGVEQEGGKPCPLTSEILKQFNMGVQFYHQREFLKAIHAYQKILEIDPTFVEAYNNLGITYQQLGDLAQADYAYRKATEINPRYEKGYNNLGVLLLLQNRDEEAIGVFQKALSINPNHLESYLNLGILFKKKGEWGKAIESYQKALSINPHHKETHYNIALLYEQWGDLELAIKHYQQFIQLSKNSHPELVLKVEKHLMALGRGGKLREK